MWPKFIGSILDSALALVRRLRNREVGWETVDRKTGQCKREQQPIYKKLKLLLLFSPIMIWLDRTHLFRLWIHEKTIAAGREEASQYSAKQIKSFVDFYHINMKDYRPSNIEDYKNFEDFFARQHAPGARPMDSPEDACEAVVVADHGTMLYSVCIASKF